MILVEHLTFFLKKVDPYMNPRGDFVHASVKWHFDSASLAWYADLNKNFQQNWIAHVFAVAFSWFKDSIMT